MIEKHVGKIIDHFNSLNWNLCIEFLLRIVSLETFFYDNGIENEHITHLWRTLFTDSVAPIKIIQKVLQHSRMWINWKAPIMDKFKEYIMCKNE